MSTDYERKSRRAIKAASSNAQKVNKRERQNIPPLKWLQPGLVHACNPNRRSEVLGKPELCETPSQGKKKNQQNKMVNLQALLGIFSFLFFFKLRIESLDGQW